MNDLQSRLLRFLRDPRVAKALQDPRTQRVMMRVLRARGRAQERLELALQKLAKTLNLATAKDIRELKRTIRRLEEELARVEKAG